MQFTKLRGAPMWLTLFVCCLLLVPCAQAAEKGPIKVGMLVEYTGPVPMQSKCTTAGVELALEQAGMKIAGRPIQFFKEDAESNPTVALTKVKRLVEEKGVQFIVGPILSNVAMAIHDYISKNNVTLIIPCAFTRVLTSPEMAKPNVWRTVETTDQGDYPMGKWMLKNTPIRKVVIAGSDYAAGHHSMEAFKAAFEEGGGQVLKGVFPKLGTIDFSSFLPAMDVAGAEALFVFFAGTDAVHFVKQYGEFGLKKKLPLYGGAVINDDPYLEAMGDAAIGTIAQTHYPNKLDTPENKAFVAAYTKKTGEDTNRYAEYGYTAGLVIVEAAKALNGDVDDVKKVSKAIRSVSSKIVTPSGPLEFDQYNQRTTNIYIVKTEKQNGKLVNVVIDKLGKVSQEDTWKWWNKK